MPSPATSQKPRRQGDFSKRVKKRLVELEMSVTDLALELGVDRNTASRAIHHQLFKPTRARIAEFLGIRQ